MRTSALIDKIAPALCEAQAVMKRALKDSTNPFHKSKYADLESVWDACKDALTASNLSVMQTFETIEGASHIVTMLLHASGQFITSSLKLPFPFDTVEKNSGQVIVKNDPQTLGSVITYCRRYALAALLGVVQTDDDAQQAVTTPPISRAQVKAIVPAKEIRMPEPKKEVSTIDSSLEILKGYIATNKGDPSRLEEFISYRSYTAKKPSESIIGAALSSKEMTAKFNDAYLAWMEKTSQLAVAS